MLAKCLTTVSSTARDSIEVLVPKQGELAELLQATLNEGADEIEIDPGVGIAHCAVFVQVEYADIGQFFAIQELVEIAGQPFQIRPLLPEALNPRRVEVDAHKAAQRQRLRSFQQLKCEQARRTHQLAPVAAEPCALAVLP